MASSLQLRWNPKLLVEIIAGLAALLTVASVSTSAFLYYVERPSRQRATIFAAWSIVSGMEGKRADGARSVALNQLRENHESLAGIVLDGSIFRNIDLSNSNLFLASLKNVEFTHCKLVAVDFTDANLQGGHFRDRCDFSSSKFERTDLRNAVLADSVLQNVQFLGSTGNAFTSFNNAHLDNSSMTNTTFNDAIFDNSELHETTFVSSGLERATFLRAILNHTRFSTVSANEAKFILARGDGTQFLWGALLDGAQFDSAQLTNPIFENCSLRGAKFFGSYITNGTFRNCNLTNANFTSVHLKSTIFENCVLEGAVFLHADIDSETLFTNSKGTPIGLSKLQ